MAATTGEHEEHSQLYPEFAAIAEKEGFPEIAAAWNAISVAEKQHEKRYRDLLANLENGRVFKRDTEVVWRCRNCGYLHTATGCAGTLPCLYSSPGTLRAACRKLVTDLFRTYW